MIMDKKKIFAAIVAFAGMFSAGAQTCNVRELVAADHDKAAGCEGPYRYDAGPLTPSPKGYEPFYISHYGRHGSRYAWNDDTYIMIKKVMDAAYRADVLTDFGKRFYDRYCGFYLVPLINTGDLTALGSEQHASVAAALCTEFPEIFSKGGRFLARSSTSPRAITSMTAFCVSMQKCAPKAEIETNSLHTNMAVIYPTECPDQLAVRFEGAIRPLDDSAMKDLRTRHYDDILGRLFTDRGFLEETGGRTKFINQLFDFWAGYHNYCETDLFEGLFTEEELVDFWEWENFRLYLSHSGDRYQMIPLLQDIVDWANEAVAGGQYSGHFRFGHDTVVNAIVPLLNLNGCGFQPDRAEDVKYWFQNYNTPKAANFEFVLYRSKKNPDILFKVLLNNSEATLPQLEPVSGPYYLWDDFVAWAEELYAAHPVIK